MFDEESLTSLREMLGAGEDFTAENAMERLGTRFKELTTSKEELSGRVGELSTEVETLKTKVSEAGGKKEDEKPMDADAAEQAAVTGEQQLELLVEKGNITPAVRDKIAASLIGTKGKRNAKALSVKTGIGGSSVFTTVVEALKENKLADLVERTGPQGVALSRQTPDGDAPAHDQKVQDEMVEQAGGGDKKE